MPTKKLNRYAAIIEKIFFSHYAEGDEEITFEREDLELAAQSLRIKLPKNLGDVIYSIRYRTKLPPSILKTQPKGKVEWSRSLKKSITNLFPAIKSRQKTSRCTPVGSLGCSAGQRLKTKTPCSIHQSDSCRGWWRSGRGRGRAPRVCARCRRGRVAPNRCRTRRPAWG